ncbi:homocysteine S-methyltransferase family protein [Kiritimatiella glycovorans]|uniref:Bifunctional homocysteine S-methyltransferase/5,10-methylenetetrahydrofolate reductase n=1 Tax=Kiritimatiella glycovorans TaxID=1307763 RepID=A0A0G3EDX6_9BACT|nr:homocysteine S-methyltransferase family protein [Kiritimatiella glycovorans]AKJ63617.1 Bifunctional homocysteine S-methyltransferase/5,10-methylenetetrahydrofolate reductase [Kiritimatiella glycovorans]
MKGDLKTAWAEGKPLLCDGAMGTMLQAAGLQPGECPERWCVDRPDDVRAIYRAYRDAGSDIVECNSFGGSRYKLRFHGLESRAHEINEAAASLARDVAGEEGIVLATIGPTGEFMEPYGTETEEAFVEAFAEQAEAFASGGADAVIVETMTGLEEAGAAVRAVREHSDLIVLVSFTFDPQLHGGFATMMGVTPEQFAGEMASLGVDAIGTNCGNGPEGIIEVVRQLRAASGLPIIAMPNAGMPVIEDGHTVFKATPGEMAIAVPRLIDAGANIIGGCCGTTPEHIAAMRRTMDA